MMSSIRQSAVASTHAPKSGVERPALNEEHAPRRPQATRPTLPRPAVPPTRLTARTPPTARPHLRDQSPLRSSGGPVARPPTPNRASRSSHGHGANGSTEARNPMVSPGARARPGLGNRSFSEPRGLAPASSSSPPAANLTAVTSVNANSAGRRLSPPRTSSIQRGISRPAATSNAGGGAPWSRTTSVGPSSEQALARSLNFAANRNNANASSSVPQRAPMSRPPPLRTCATAGCTTPHLGVKVSSGLCMTCSNKLASESGGSRIKYDPTTGQPVPNERTVAEAYAKNDELRAFLLNGHRTRDDDHSNSNNSGGGSKSDNVINAGPYSGSSRAVCKTPNCATPHKMVRVSSGLCVTCSNKRAASSGGRHLMVDPDTGALMSAVAPPPVAAKNQALRKYLGQGEALSGAGNWGQKEQEEEEEKTHLQKSYLGGSQQAQWPQAAFVSRSDPALVELRRRELAEEALIQSEAEARAKEAQAFLHAPKPTPSIQHFRVPDQPLDDDDGDDDDDDGGHSMNTGGADDDRRRGGGGTNDKSSSSSRSKVNGNRSSGGRLAQQFSVSVPRPAIDPYGRKGYDNGRNHNYDNGDNDNEPHLEEKDDTYGSSIGSGGANRRQGWPYAQKQAEGHQRAPSPSPFTFDVRVPRHDSSLAPNPSSAPGGYKPDDRATLSGMPRFKSHVPSLHGPLSGLPAQRQPTYAPAKAGSKSIAAQLEDMRIERAKKLNKLEAGWNSGYGSVQSDKAREDMLNEFMAQQDQLTDAKLEKEKAKKLKAKEERDARKEKDKKKWRDRKAAWKTKRKNEKEAKAKRKADEAEAKKNEAEKLLKDRARSLTGGDDSDDDDDDDSGDDSDDSSTSEMSVEAVKAAKEEEAMEKADEGDFIGDICIVCAFGLPKVDYWGSVDPYVKPTWDGEGERVTLNGLKFDLKRNRGKGAEVAIQVEGRGKDLCMRNTQMPRFDMHFRIDFSKQTNPDAELWIEVWDYDRLGDDDLISVFRMGADEVKERCCSTLPTKKQGKFNLECKPGAVGKELKWGVGNLTLQFKLKENVDLQVEAQKKSFGRTRQKYIQDKIRVAREDFAV